MSEKYNFDTDISSLLNLIINNFYSNKDIFLRELLSNASDSIDRYNYNCLINKIEDKIQNKITIIPDKDNKQLLIIDTGDGMDKQDLIKNIGTIANSGTKAFMEKAKDTNLIGKFGVGFYSAFLVADKVSIISNKDKEIWKWESDATNNYTIEKLDNYTINKDINFNQGSIIKLMLKEDLVSTYTDTNKLKNIIKEHSQYINHPIEILIKKEITKEVEDEDTVDDIDVNSTTKITENTENTENTKNNENSDNLDDLFKVNVDNNSDNNKTNNDDVIIEDVKDEQETKVKEKKMKKITEYVNEYQVVNENKPIWLRNSNEVTTEEYNNFYKSLCNDIDNPYCYKHIKGEGQVEYKGILFLPKKTKTNIFERGVKQNNIKIYVRKIFVSDNSNTICPEWLHFISGMIDTDDLPLTVSREMLQENKIIQIIKKTITKKSIDMLRTAMQDIELYTKIYNTYQKNIKLGVYEESADRERVADLLLYYSLNSPDKYISFDDYITNIAENQKEIYYISGDDIELLKLSPFLDRFKKNKLDVLYMTDTVDEYMCQRLSQYKDYKLICITKGDVELPNTTQDHKDLIKSKQDEYKILCDFIKKNYNTEFIDAKISDKIESLPCIVTSPEYGFTANMEKIIKAQTLAQNDSTTNYMLNKRILEINPNHTFIQKIKNIDDTEQYKSYRDLLDLIINSSLLYSGYPIIKPVDFSKKVINVVMVGLDLYDIDDKNNNDNNTNNSNNTDNVETIDVTQVD